MVALFYFTKRKLIWSVVFIERIVFKPQDGNEQDNSQTQSFRYLNKEKI